MAGGRHLVAEELLHVQSLSVIKLIFLSQEPTRDQGCAHHGVVLVS